MRITHNRFSKSARHSRRVLLIGGTLLFGACSASDLSGNSTNTEFGIVSLSEIYEVPGYAELVATADLVVEANVADVKRGPALGEEKTVGVLDVTLEVSEWLKGRTVGGTLRLFAEGYDPDTGQDLIVQGQADVEVGQHGIWFLKKYETISDTYYQLTTAGRVVRSHDDRAKTEGPQAPAAALCNMPWAKARQEIIAAVERSPSVSPLEKFKDYNVVSVPNKCEQSIEERVAERRAAMEEEGLAPIERFRPTILRAFLRLL